MLQDPNVEPYVKGEVDPLRKKIKQLELKIKELTEQIKNIRNYNPGDIK